MKTKLDLARESINEIDEKMIDLFKLRMNAVKQIAEYKIENDIPVLDSNREDEIINKNVNKLNDKELEKYYLDFLEGVLSSSKKFQNDLINKKR